jgi:hypothetical protein
MKEMTREKEKLNRFLVTKEASMQKNQDYSDKMRKQLQEKEKKQQKVLDVMKKEQKNKNKRFQEANEVRRLKLFQYETEKKDKQNESKQHYIEHIKEL